MGRVVLRLPSSYGDGTAAAGQARRVRSNHGMYPQCVLANAKQLVASPFLVNISGLVFLLSDFLGWLLLGLFFIAVSIISSFFLFFVLGGHRLLLVLFGDRLGRRLLFSFLVLILLSVVRLFFVLLSSGRLDLSGRLFFVVIAAGLL